MSPTIGSPWVSIRESCVIVAFFAIKATGAKLALSKLQEKRPTKEDIGVWLRGKKPTKKKVSKGKWGSLQNTTDRNFEFFSAVSDLKLYLL